MNQWNDDQPIYRQLRDRVIASILDGELAEGEALPSVRQVAAEFRVNPLTISKAYQTLVDDELVEKRRGLGMFVVPGAQESLLRQEQDKFLTQEWPLIIERIRLLGLSLKELLSNSINKEGRS